MEVQECEKIAQKVLDVLEHETASMCWMNEVTVGLYVATKIFSGLFDACIAKEDPAGINGIMRALDGLIKKYNQSVPSKLMKDVERLRKKGW